MSDLEVYESCGHSHDIQKTPVDLLASKTVNLQGFFELQILQKLELRVVANNYILKYLLSFFD